MEPATSQVRAPLTVAVSGAASVSDLGTIPFPATVAVSEPVPESVTVSEPIQEQVPAVVTEVTEPVSMTAQAAVRRYENGSRVTEGYGGQSVSPAPCSDPITPLWSGRKR